MATTAINFLVSLLTSNSLSQVWGLIEGVQVTVALPLFDVKTPGNVQTFLEGLENLASFDLIPESYTQWWMFIPESEALSLNFQQAGYDTELLIPNLGTLFYLLVFQLCLYGLHFIMLIIARSCPKLKKATQILGNYIYWNGSLRLMIEGYMDIVMATCLNLSHFEWNGDVAVNVTSHTVAVFFFVAAVVFPVCLIIYLACNMARWNDEAFQARNGTLLDGVNLERKEVKWIVLLVPASFFMRRLLMVMTLVFWTKFIWG